MKEGGQLSAGEKIGYALGDTASNLYWKVFEFFLLVFYTDVFGISPVAAGTLFLVARIWDAVNDPMMGIIADRTKSRWGRYRPWLIWMILPLLAAGVLTFSTPDLPEGGKVIYAYVTYILMMMAYTAINIPYSALMGVITPNSEERTSVSSYRFVGAFSGGVFVQFSTLWLVKWLGNGDPTVGWPLTMVLFGIIAGVLFSITFATTKERVEPIEEQTNLRADIATLGQNDALGIMLVLGTVILANFAIRGSTVVYYLTYYVGVHEMTLFGTEIPDVETLVTLFLTSGGVANVLGVLVTTPLTQRIGKRRAYLICMGSGALLTFGLFGLPGTELEAIVVLNLVINFVLGPTAPIMFAMYADVADYGEWKTGNRSTGLVFSGAMLSLKFGAAIGGFAAGWVLEAFDYVPNVDQSETALLGILLLVSVIPGVLSLIGVGAMFFYPLSDAKMKEIGVELEQRREQAAA
ncbi:MAG: MFS transporter [Myxococcota bacterium]